MPKKIRELKILLRRAGWVQVSGGKGSHSKWRSVGEVNAMSVAKNNQPRYSVIIQWSQEDECYVVSLPEWGPYAKTHGDTYEQAARNAQEVLEMLMENENGHPVVLPAPLLFHYPGATVTDLPPDVVGTRRKTKVSHRSHRAMEPNRKVRNAIA